MKMLLDKIKLRLLLEKRRDHIKNKVEGIDILITALIYVVSLLCCEFKTVLGLDKMVIQTLAWVLAFAIIVYGVYKMIKSLKNRYNHEMLFGEIENLDEVLHKFSIVAIKDSFEKYANRFLLYYDDNWKCWFFFSFHTADYQNEESVIHRLSNKLKIDAKAISLAYVSDRIQPKFSEKDQVNKVYYHTLYVGTISKFSDVLKQKEFELDGIRYRWFTIEEMESDEVIMNKNKDVVSFVKEKIV